MAVHYDIVEGTSLRLPENISFLPSLRHILCHKKLKVYIETHLNTFGFKRV